MSLGPTLKLFHINILGIDYLIWGFLFIQLLAISTIQQHFKVFYPKSYLKVLLWILVFITMNYFTSKYVTSLLWYSLGTIFTLIVPITFLISVNISLNESNIQKIIKKIVLVITVIIILIYLESFFIYHSYFHLANFSLLKSNGFAGTLTSLNIIFSLTLFQLQRKKKYIYLVVFSLITLALLGLLKSLITSIIVLNLYMFIFFRNKVKATLMIIVYVGAIVGAFSSNYLRNKVNKYMYIYAESSSVSSTPRIALYITAFQIAEDEFPFGSGQGTYGSFPVSLKYNNVYYAFGLNKIYGLKKDSKVNYLLDSYWSSIIGEMGFICSIFYLYIFMYPAISLRKYFRYKIISPYVFLVVATILDIVIESIALAIPFQVSFILVYSGLTGIIYRFIKEKTYIICQVS